MKKLAGYNFQPEKVHFSINRASWRKGQLAPSLFRSGKTDVFGALALSLGIGADSLWNLSSLPSLTEDELFSHPSLLSFLRPDITGELFLTILGLEIMRVNYSHTLTGEEIEHRLKFLFSREGFIPHFSGSYPKGSHPEGSYPRGDAN